MAPRGPRPSMVPVGSHYPHGSHPIMAPRGQIMAPLAPLPRRPANEILVIWLPVDLWDLWELSWELSWDSGICGSYLGTVAYLGKA
eukprot:747267-Pyramimonas_sp.AAC.1